MHCKQLFFLSFAASPSYISARAEWEANSGREIEVHPGYNFISPVKKIPKIVLFSVYLIRQFV